MYVLKMKKKAARPFPLIFGLQLCTTIPQGLQQGLQQGEREKEMWKTLGPVVCNTPQNACFPKSK
jgi:hypothetical protein